MRLELARDERAPSAARHAIEQLPPAISARQRTDGQLLLSELVTNSVQHGAGEQILVLVDALADSTLHCEVVDGGDGFVPRRRSDAQKIGGWGLDLVEQLATSWGVHTGSTHVWFELAPQPAVTQ
jgi:anti-sigma regulatory factor (Ser/Thr protein kinase)